MKRNDVKAWTLQVNQILKYAVEQKIDQYFDEMLIFLEKLVRQDSTTPEGKLELLKIFQQQAFELFGTSDPSYATEEINNENIYKIHHFPGEDVLEIVINGTGSYLQSFSQPLLFLGHGDTVYPPYAITGIGEDKPIVIDLEKMMVYGSGVLDMKGGLVIMLYTAYFLYNYHYQRSIKMIITTNEEHGHTSTKNFTELMMDLCEGAKAGFSFETASPDRNIIVQRAGIMQADYTIVGRAAHTGRDPEQGIDAIKKAAEIVNTLTTVNDKYRITVGTIHGGEHRNVICDEVKMKVDIRVYNQNYRSEILEKLHSWCCPMTDGTRVLVEITDGISEMECTEGNLSLYDLLRRCSHDHQIDIGEPIFSGGAGDAAYAVNVGVPMIDQMGIEGSYNHTKQEVACLESLKRKILLSVLTVIDQLS